jgi:RHS repeat-associated protein
MRQHNLSGNWSNDNIINAYSESIAYDANGNILKYLRHGADVTSLSLNMDSMHYKYNRNIAGNLINNKLHYIIDSVNSANYSDDIDNQANNNYSYDKSGNLTKDIAEGVDTVLWTSYGKINSIEKNVGTSIHFNYDANKERIVKQVVYNDTLNTTFYIRGVNGNVLSIYTYSSLEGGSLRWSEQHLYGNNRLGVWRCDTISPASPPIVINNNPIYDSLLYGSRVYELTNQLDNVLSTINDKKIGHDSSGIVDYYVAEVLTQNDYYSFGMLMNGREYRDGSNYRYGFNGKENDNEIKGVGNQQDYGMRIYDPRIGRFLSVDPLHSKYPWYTPYQFAGNKPIIAIDVDGEEDQIVVAKFYNGNKEGEKTLTAKDAEFKTILKALPKDLKGLVPGVGTLVIDQYRFDYGMNIGNPNYNDYRYYTPADKLSPKSVKTEYIRGISNWAMTSPFSPQNWTLENWGVRSVGVGLDLGVYNKASASMTKGNYKQAIGGESRTTVSLKLIDNGGEYNKLNLSTQNTVEFSGTKGISITPRTVLKLFKIPLPAEGFAYFTFMGSVDPPQVSKKPAKESVNTVRILWLKIQQTVDLETGKFEVKIGVSTDYGIEAKTAVRGKETDSSNTTKVKLGNNR